MVYRTVYIIARMVSVNHTLENLQKGTAVEKTVTVSAAGFRDGKEKWMRYYHGAIWAMRASAVCSKVTMDSQLRTSGMPGRKSCGSFKRPYMY